MVLESKKKSRVMWDTLSGTLPRRYECKHVHRCLLHPVCKKHEDAFGGEIQIRRERVIALVEARQLLQAYAFGVLRALHSAYPEGRSPNASAVRQVLYFRFGSGFVFRKQRVKRRGTNIFC